ncbi:MAG: Na+/H+ antiporter NhaA [Leptolyngbyaceae cyanobacterium RU_5_1]|nr:Na+/H+ antiporter NhaA [Leptolyngbyaceae cyanobacterium RU_5_1]
MEQIASRIKNFIEMESAGGLALGVAALFAFALSNSPLYLFTRGLLSHRVGFEVGAMALNKPLSLWINDGLMAIFFFLVGLEIKRVNSDQGELWETISILAKESKKVPLAIDLDDSELKQAPLNKLEEMVFHLQQDLSDLTKLVKEQEDELSIHDKKLGGFSARLVFQVRMKCCSLKTS